MKRDVKVGYTVLRYVHDITTQEFVNIGVLAYSPELRQLKLKCSDRLRRIHALFPEVDSKKFSSLIKFVENAFSAYACHLGDRTTTKNLPAKVMAAAASVIPEDSSSLQWSPAAGGYATSVNEALESAFHRYVEKHDRRRQRSRGIGAVLQPFRSELKSAGLWHHLKPRTFTGTVERYEFNHTWKNKVYHCFEPVNLNLRDPKQVEAKAMEWIGRAVDLEKSAEEDHRLHLLLAAPSTPSMHSTYKDTAKGMRSLMPKTAEVIEQDQVPAFATRIAKDITRHLDVEAAR